MFTDMPFDEERDSRENKLEDMMPGAVTKGKKILLVDDASVFLSLAGKMLERTGAHILTARNGIDAIRIVQTENPDVIVLDLVMPEMTGDKVCQMVKGDPATSDIPVIIVTSRGMPEEIERCRRAGCDDFLTKPVKEGILFSKVCDLLKVSNRHAIRLLVRIEKSEGKEVFFGATRDLSKTGMQLDSQALLQISEQITLRFFLKGDQEEITVSGKVVRAEQAEHNAFRYGVQFVATSLPQKRALMQFLESRSSK